MSTETGVRKLLDNKQLVHIVSEIAVIFGVIFYFSSKNKKLSSHIDELAQRLEQQEDIIQKLSEKMNQLESGLQQVARSDRLEECEKRITNIGNALQHVVQEQVFAPQGAPQGATPKPAAPRQVSTPKPVPQGAPQVIQKPVPRPPPKMVPTIIEVVEENDSDVDDEIQDELAELNKDV